MKKLILTMIFVAFVFSQNLSQGLGFAAGMPSGAGFSYRFVGNNLGFQISSGMISFNNGDDEYPMHPQDGTNYFDCDGVDTSTTYSWNDYGRNTSGNLGLLLIRPLHRSEQSLFYGFLGLSGYFHFEEVQAQDYHYICENDSTVLYEEIGDLYSADEFETTWFFGAGIGIQWNLTENIRISAELPITVSDKKDFFMYIPQVGLHYYFR